MMKNRLAPDRHAQHSPTRRTAMIAGLGLLAHAPAFGQQTRQFPAGTRLGRLTMGVFPEAAIDGEAVRFSPGARILSTNDAVLIPSTLTQPVLVRYRVDSMGQIGQAWILTDAELVAARREARR